MNSITLHNLDEDVGTRLRTLSKRQGLSINQVAQRLLRQALGFAAVPSQQGKSKFSEFSGLWSKKEAQALLLFAFASDAIQNIDIEPLKVKISNLLAEKLGVESEFE